MIARRFTFEREIWGSLLVWLLATEPMAATSAPLLYPAPQDGSFMRTSNVKVRIGGQPAFVYALMHVGNTYGRIPTIASDFTSFDWNGEAVEVSLDYFGVPIIDVRIRRLGADVPALRTGNRITFRIDRPGAYEIEVNHDLRNRGPVLVFANTPDNRSIQPGDITFPPGKVTDAGVLHITKDGQCVYIPGGAIVRALIRVDGASNVRIAGHGVLLYDDKSAGDFKNEFDRVPFSRPARTT